MFELSKCDRLDIRSRMVAGLRNVEDDLARAVAGGLGLTELPDPVQPARQPVRDLAPSPALSILKNGPDTFAGRKIGILATDGIDPGALSSLRSEAGQQGVTAELIAATVGGIETSNGGGASPPTRKSTAARRSSTTRSSSWPPRSGPRSWRRCPRRGTS